MKLSRLKVKINPSIKKLSWKKRNEFFKQKFSHEEYIKYEFVFLFNEVKKLAEKNGIKIRYCKPKTEGYKMYGSFCFQVLLKSEKEKTLHPCLFDPELLVL